MSLRRSKSKNEEEEELILGGFSIDSSSDSDSELSETWSELGAQIFGDENIQDQNIDDSNNGGCGFDGSFDGEYSQESDLILDMKIDNPVIVNDNDNSTTTSPSTETELFCPSTTTLSINHSPNLNNKLFSKCNLCPPSNTTYFHGEDNLRNHIDQVHKNKNKATIAQSTTIPTTTPTSSGILQNKEPIQSQQLQTSCSICDRRFSSLEFSKIHHQFHLEGLKCIDYTCQVICRDLAELKGHTSLCPLAIRCKQVTRARHTLHPINCIYTCPRVFLNDVDFLRHLKTFHGETLQTLCIKFGFKPTKEIKVDDLVEVDEIFYIGSIPHSKETNNLTDQPSNLMRTRCIKFGTDSGEDPLCQVINSVAQGAGTPVPVLNVNERKRVLYEKKKQRCRERYQRKIAHKTKDPERLARKNEKVARGRLRTMDIGILKCDICSRDFVRQGDLSNHKRIKHPEIYLTRTSLIEPEPSISLPLPSCSICDRRFSSLEFSKIHHQFHLEGLKCIDYTCQVICRDLAELQGHTSLCPLAMRCKKETKTRRILSPISCVFTDCTRGFYNDLDFLGHLKAFHEETLQTLSTKFGTVDSGSYNKPTTASEDIKVDLDELDVSDSDTLSQVINSVAQGAGTVVINGRKIIFYEERKEKYRELYRQKKATAYDTQVQRQLRAQRLARKRQKLARTRQRNVEKDRVRRAHETVDQKAQRLARQRQRNRIIGDRKRELARKRLRQYEANETEDQRAERLVREGEITRERLAKEADLILTCSLGYIPPDVMDSMDEIIELVVQGQGSEPFNVHLERKKRKAKLDRKQLLEETEEQRAKRLERQRIRRQIQLSKETQEQREKRLEKQRIRQQKLVSKLKETEGQRGERLQDQKPNLNLLQIQIEILRCDICSRNFERKCNLTRHNRIKHPDFDSRPDLANNREVCEVCGKIFMTSSSLKVHSISHKEKIYTCSWENCTKSFAIEKYLSQHISRFHSPTSGQLGPKIFLCDLCGQSYSKLEGYKYHKERHSRILAMRKEAYEKKIRSENLSKSDGEIGEILQKFWQSEESISLVVDPETYEEKKAIRKQDFIEKIKRMGLQRYGENVEECLARITRERLEKIWKKREAETDEERLKRRERYLKGFKKHYENNKKAYFKRIKEYNSNRSREYTDSRIKGYKRILEYQRNRWRKQMTDPEFRAKTLAKDRARWAKKTPEQKAMRLESMRNYQKQRKRKPHD